MSIEKSVYDFLVEKVAAAAVGTPLKDAEVGDSEFAEMSKDFGLQVATSEGDLSPIPGATAVERFNVDLTLICYYAIDREKDQRADERDKVEAMALAAALLFVIDPTCGGRVNDCLAKRITMGYGPIDGTLYALANVLLRVNDMGNAE